MTIVEFLEARLTEDEAVAKEPHHQNWDLYPYWFRPNGEDPAEGSVIAAERVPDGALSGLIRYITGPEEIDLADAAHVARHDPARVLREVAAKRAVMSRHREVKEDDELGWMWSRYASDHNRSQPCAGCGVWGDPDLPVTDRVEDCPELHALASVYADHSDFNPDWAE